MMMMTSHVARVEKKKVESCMTCPLCNELYREPTTISECLHTFCRKCIYEKIREEELNSCPVCDSDLGCAPFDKLRADHNLQELREKLFPSKRKMNEVADTVTSAPIADKRRERSVYLLEDNNATKISNQSRMTRNRKYPAQKNVILREPTLTKQDSPVEIKISSSEHLSKTFVDAMKNCTSESTKQHILNNALEDQGITREAKDDLWKPINCLVESSSKTMPKELNMPVTVLKSVLPNRVNNNALNELKLKDKEQSGNKSRANGDEKYSTPPPPKRRRKVQGVRQTRELSSIAAAQTVVDSDTSTICGSRFRSIWFSLIASSDQVGYRHLPQISPRYLRVRDGSLLVSHVKKYIARKLNLGSETQVDVSLRGQALVDSLRMHEVVDIWLKSVPTSETIKTSLGSSGKDFVMLLSYALKAH